MAEDNLTIASPKRKIIWEPEPDKPAPPPVQALPTLPAIDHQKEFMLPANETAIVVESKRAYKKRAGNGHKSEKIRDLFDFEKDVIKEDLFLPKNGQIDNDDCVAFRDNAIKGIVGKLSAFNEIAIFQITGYVSVLHTQVAEGRLMVDDICAYEEWMRTKYGRLWARYNQRLFTVARTANMRAIAEGREPTARARNHNALSSEGPTTVAEPLQANVQQQRIANSVGTMFSGSGAVNLMPAFVSFGKRRFASQ